MAAQGMTDEEIFDYYNNGLRKESFIKARIAHYKKPPEPKNEPEVETVKDEPKPDTDMWASVAQAQAQMQEEDTDLLHADLWQALGKFVDGDTNVETLAMLRHVAGKILSADRSVK